MSNLPLPGFLLRWLGVDVDSLEGGSAHISFVRFPEGELGLLAILGVLGAIAIVVVTYLNEGKLARWKKLALAGLRGALLVLLALIVFYPVLEIDRARDLRAVTGVLLDDSLSFGIKDRYQGAVEDGTRTAEFLDIPKADLIDRTRADLVNRLLEEKRHGFLSRLAEKNRLEVFTFSDDLRRLTGRDASDEDSTDTETTPRTRDVPTPTTAAPRASIPRVRLEPRGASTDLSGALRSMVERQGGARFAGVVVISDGRLTAGTGLSDVQSFLRERQIPVHTIGIGDPTPPRNFRVTTLLASERVFAGDPVVVDVSVSQKGYDGETIQVELLDQSAPQGGTFDEERVLDTQEVIFGKQEIEDENAGSQEEGVARFKVDLEGVGRHRLTARVTVRPEEAFADDNERSADVEVIEEASRVLMIAGSPTWEYRYLQNLLRRDKRVTVSAWLMSADPQFPQEGNVRLSELPTEPRTLFEFDVVILLDPDQEELPGEYPVLLERFVGQQNGGLVFVAGEKFTAELFHSQDMKPLTDMLPIVPDLPRAEAAGEDSYSVSQWPLLPTRLASAHNATRLSSRPDRNRERWEQLPGIYWSFPVRKPKPGANVLFVHADPARHGPDGAEPVMAWQYYAGGRTIYLGTDETWRWRSTTEEIYDQFWMQTVRYLTEGRLTGGKRKLIQLDRDEYELGDVVRVSALLEDESFRPATEEYQVVVIESPDGEETSQRLEKDSTAPGWYRGVFVPRRLGTYRIRLADGTETLVRVEPPAIEYQEPQLDEATLRSLAQSTGGTFSRIWEAAEVPNRIEDRRQTVVTTDEPVPLWDNWFLLSLLTALLTIEWVFRKLVRLL